MKESSACLEVFWAFLRLGLTSFGGPVAHLSYFRARIRRAPPMARRSGLCRSRRAVPVPARSREQPGRLRARPDTRRAVGALAAWIGFTLPSAIALVRSPTAPIALQARSAHGLAAWSEVVAVAVVAQAVWGMARTCVPTAQRASLAVVAAALVLALPHRRRPDRRDRRSAASPACSVLGGADRPHSAVTIGAPSRHALAIGARLSSSCCSACRSCAAAYRISRASRCSTPSIAPARWCSAAAMSCCRCCSRRSCRRAGSATTPFSPAMARRRRFRARCSPSPPISARMVRARRTASPAPRSASSRSFCRAFLLVIGVLPFWGLARPAPGRKACSGRQRRRGRPAAGRALPPGLDRRRSSGADFALAVAAFLLLTVWKTPPWAVVVFGAMAASLIAAV